MTNQNQAKISDEQHIAYLNLLQGAINRMAGNSFMLKGWAVSFVAVLIGFGVKESDWRIAAMAFGPILIFWWFDAYFQLFERAYREMYNRVIAEDWQQADNKKREPKLYSLNPKDGINFLKEQKKPTTISALMIQHDEQFALLGFYGLLCLFSVVFLVLVICNCQ